MEARHCGAAQRSVTTRCFPNRVATIPWTRRAPPPTPALAGSAGGDGGLSGGGLKGTGGGGSGRGDGPGASNSGGQPSQPSNGGLAQGWADRIAYDPEFPVKVLLEQQAFFILENDVGLELEGAFDPNPTRAAVALRMTWKQLDIGDVLSLTKRLRWRNTVVTEEARRARICRCSFTRLGLLMPPAQLLKPSRALLEEFKDSGSARVPAPAHHPHTCPSPAPTPAPAPIPAPAPTPAPAPHPLLPTTLTPQLLLPATLQVIGVSASVVGDMSSRPNWGLNELDFVFSTLVVGSVLNFLIMYLLAPTASTAASGAAAGGFIARVLSDATLKSWGAPGGNMFEAGAYSVGGRMLNVTYKGTVFAVIGFLAGIAGTAISNTLLALRKTIDPNFKLVNEQPGVLANAGCWGIHMGVSANLRYQLLGGLDPIAGAFLPLPLLRVYQAGIRAANNVVGGISFVTLARVLGVQKSAAASPALATA